jgi:hypothetical protein
MSRDTNQRNGPGAVIIATHTTALMRRSVNELDAIGAIPQIAVAASDAVAAPPHKPGRQTPRVS